MDLTDKDCALANDMARLVAAVLEGLTQGQGYVEIMAWDNGAGGGLSKASLLIEHLRDGAFFEKEYHGWEEEEAGFPEYGLLIELITQALLHEGGLSYKIAIDRYANARPAPEESHG